MQTEAVLAMEKRKSAEFYNRIYGGRFVRANPAPAVAIFSPIHRFFHPTAPGRRGSLRSGSQRQKTTWQRGPRQERAYRHHRHHRHPAHAGGFFRCYPAQGSPAGRSQPGTGAARGNRARPRWQRLPQRHPLPRCRMVSRGSALVRLGLKHHDNAGTNQRASRCLRSPTS